MRKNVPTAEKNQLKNKYETRLRNHDETANADIQQDLKDGNLNRKDVMLIRRAIRTPYLQHVFNQLSLNEALHVVSVAEPDEKKNMMPLLRKKMHLTQDMSLEERRNARSEFKDLSGE